jgi:hypothetical protein
LDTAWHCKASAARPSEIQAPTRAPRIKGDMRDNSHARDQHKKANKSKTFFFEKKNQKTFAPLREVLKPPRAKIIKVFLLLFVHKKKFLLSYFILRAAESPST